MQYSDSGNFLYFLSFYIFSGFGFFPVLSSS